MMRILPIGLACFRDENVAMWRTRESSVQGAGRFAHSHRTQNITIDRSAGSGEEQSTLAPGRQGAFHTRAASCGKHWPTGCLSISPVRGSPRPGMRYVHSRCCGLLSPPRGSRAG